MMKKLIVVAAALVALAGYALAAWADDCPPGTTSSCYTTNSGKQGCRRWRRIDRTSSHAAGGRQRRIFDS